MHKSPYTGEAAATLEKLMDGRQQYYTNTVYQFRDTTTLFYINARGYLHTLRPTRERFRETIYYCVEDHILTAGNTLKYTRTIYRSSSKEETADTFRGMIGERLTA